MYYLVTKIQQENPNQQDQGSQDELTKVSCWYNLFVELLTFYTGKQLAGTGQSLSTRGMNFVL